MITQLIDRMSQQVKKIPPHIFNQHKFEIITIIKYLQELSAPINVEY
jgi:hypothetical protein